MSGKILDKENAAQFASGLLGRPTRWWQWLLVYPALAVAIVGAVPTYMEAFKAFDIGVPYGQSTDAEGQNKLWQRNAECLKSSPIRPITNKSNVQIGSLVCESGDVVLVGKRPEWRQPQYMWISWSKVAPKIDKKKTSQSFSFFVPSAYAEAENIQLAQFGPMQVICQRWVQNGVLLQRIASPQGCYDQLINTFNGFVIRQMPAPCMPAC